MKQYWEKLRVAVDEISLRERVMIFVAAVFVLGSLMNTILLGPLLAKRDMLNAQMGQQQEKLKELRAQMQNLLQAKRDDEHSPLRQHLAELKQQLKEQNGYLQDRKDRLIGPDEIAGLLKKVLDNNGRLQLVELKTLPVSLLIEKKQPASGKTPTAEKLSARDESHRQIFKHGVRITVRGGYLDLLHYVAALENLPVQMFWGEADLHVEKYPDAVFTLTLYTLSLDKTWMAV